MKKVFFILTLCLISICAKAQMTEPNELVQVYCEVTCYQYNLFKGDVNALVDFGIAEKAKYANGWIYNTENDKKYSLTWLAKVGSTKMPLLFLMKNYQ